MSEQDYDFEIGFYESVLKRDPADTTVIELLASLYTKVGRIDEGFELDRRHVKIDPRSPTAHYNLACSLALKDRADEALGELRKALELGFDDYDWARKDPDFKPIRNDPRFQSLIEEFENA